MSGVHTSLERRLISGLALVGAIGALCLLLFIGIEYGLTFSVLFDPAELPVVTHELTEHVLIPILVLILPMTLAGRWVVRSSLRPLEHQAREIDEASENERGFRVDATSLPREVVPFADAVNALLERIDLASREQEAFAADVAHELRTPLSVLALEIERLDHPASERLKEDVARMRRLIEQLMILAQLDIDTPQVADERVLLRDVAEDVASLMAPVAIRQRRKIAVESEGGDYVVGRREAIAAAVRNLVDNALRVTPEGGTVTIVIGPGRRISVRDEGPGLAPEKLDQLRHRYKRADHASNSGAGLGLAIVSRIAAAHGASFTTIPAEKSLRLQFA
ncbi:sensor histidine kinase [Stakelama marina]|uniref:histidine kinase n=1 Tax=Stakelama marina TaxID=2826939 RepID=A0A8T4IFL0_9SPHN|nr:ATP-binding protein [Stakelama marina]MBR0551845.1 sensor histidine kinase [Stakelama marina]